MNIYKPSFAMFNHYKTVLTFIHHDFLHQKPATGSTDFPSATLERWRPWQVHEDQFWPGRTAGHSEQQGDVATGQDGENGLYFFSWMRYVLPG